MTLNFEQANSAEQLERIERLATTIWNEHYTPIIGKGQVDYMLEKFQSMAAMQRQISDEGYCYYSILKNAELIGYFAVKPEQSALFLSKLYLDKPARGQGYSRQAQQFIEQLAHKLGLSQLRLTVNKYNTGSIKAYTALGFETVEEAVFDIGAGYVMDDYVMVKRLQ